MKDLKNTWLANRPIAHRGLHDENYPENSIPAFKAAVDSDYPIELDVQMTSDGEIIVFHDLNTLRMTGISKNIRDIDSDNLSSFNLIQTGYTIPTLKQVLDLVNEQVPLLIDIKNIGLPTSLETSLCELLKNYKGKLAIQSFNPFSIWLVRKICPDIITGQIYKPPSGEGLVTRFLLKNCRLNFLTKPDFISFRLNDTPKRLLEIMRERGLVLCCWTIKSRKDQEKALKCCDNYIFEKIRP